MVAAAATTPEEAEQAQEKEDLLQTVRELLAAMKSLYGGKVAEAERLGVICDSRYYVVAFDESLGSLRFAQSSIPDKSSFLANDDLLQQLFNPFVISRRTAISTAYGFGP